jgi:hypothetical protein
MIKLFTVFTVTLVYIHTGHFAILSFCPVVASAFISKIQLTVFILAALRVAIYNSIGSKGERQKDKQDNIISWNLRLDFYFNTAWKFQLHKGIYSFRSRRINIQKTLVSAQLKLLFTVVVHVWRTVYSVNTFCVLAKAQDRLQQHPYSSQFSQFSQRFCQPGCGRSSLV